MGFFNNFPYSNFHEINLDWIVKTVKEAAAKTNSFEQALEEIRKTLATLDISAEVAAKLEEMEASGELGEIITNVFAEIKAGSFEMAFLSGKPDIGTCCVMHCDGVTAIYDIGVNDGSALIEYLRTKNYKKVDYIFISHPHADHIGGDNAIGLSNLLAAADIDFADCKAVLGCQNVDWSRWIGDNYSATMATLRNIFNDKNIEILNPRSGDIVNIGSSRAEILNVNGGDFESYYNYTLYSTLEDVGVTNLNNFSMCLRITHNNYSYFLSGDIEPPAEENVATKCANVDVLLIEHHGYNYKSADNYLNIINPKIGVLTAWPEQFPRYQSVHPTEYKALANGVVLNTYNGGNVTIWDDINGLHFNTATGLVSSSRYNACYAGKDVKTGNYDNFAPGFFSVQNYATQQNLEGRPEHILGACFGATVKATQFGSPWQFVAALEDRSHKIALRSGVNLGDYAWKYIQPGAYLYKTLVAEDFEKNVTVSSSGDRLARICLQNNLCSVTLDFTTNEEIAEGTNFLIIDTAGNNNSHGAFMLLSTVTGEIYPVRIVTSSTKIYFNALKTIPSGTRVFGTVSFDCNASTDRTDPQ